MVDKDAAGARNAQSQSETRQPAPPKSSLAALSPERVQRARDLASHAFKNARTDIKPVNKDLAEKIIAAAKQAQAAGMPFIGGSKTAHAAEQSTEAIASDIDMPKMLTDPSGKHAQPKAGPRGADTSKPPSSRRSQSSQALSRHQDNVRQSVLGLSNPFRPHKPSTAPNLRALPAGFNSRIPAPPPRRIRIVLPLLIGVAFVVVGLKITSTSSVFLSPETMSQLFGAVAIAQQADDPTEAEAKVEDRDDSEPPVVDIPTNEELTERMSALPADRLEELRRQLEQLEEDDETVGLFTEIPERFQERVSERLREIDNRERLLLERQILLETVEVRIEKKIEELTMVRDEIQEQIDQMRQEAAERYSNKILRLVKVYESMKPKQAAAVFNTVDIEVLVPVAEKMKEARLSAIIAVMENERAVELTGRLAESDRERVEQLGSVANGSAAQDGGAG